MHFILIAALLIALPSPTRASSLTCANLLASGGYKMILRQAGELGVADLETVLPLQSFYLQLKEAEWSVVDASEIRARLASRSGRYQIEELSDQDSIQFYRNALRSLYIRVAEMWRVQEVRTQVGPVMKPEIEEILSALLARSFSPWSLEDADLQPASARTHFAERKWMFWPWVKLAGFINGYLESKKEFSDYWDEHDQELPFEFYQKLKLAIAQKNTKACCLSEPGCRNCPHNRAWLK